MDKFLFNLIENWTMDFLLLPRNTDDKVTTPPGHTKIKLEYKTLCKKNWPSLSDKSMTYKKEEGEKEKGQVKEEKSCEISTLVDNTENTFDKFQYPLMTKTLNKLGRAHC